MKMKWIGGGSQSRLENGGNPQREPPVSVDITTEYKTEPLAVAPGGR
jgi:hypothetical protein